MAQSCDCKLQEHQYLPAHNRPFARPPDKREDYQGRKPTAQELRQVFRLETELTIQQRFGSFSSKVVIYSYRREIADGVRPNARRWRANAGTIEVHFRGGRTTFTELKLPQPKLPELRPAGPLVMVVRKVKDHRGARDTGR